MTRVLSSVCAALALLAIACVGATEVCGQPPETVTVNLRIP
jgi:hypothetical protein